ncbi:MAG: tRNA uridine-5-carboxymethylaminomethyl(34) synthesis GTPase MnmE [Flavobacteriales bacterium]|nr:MAG: tRNA uridine-5-carboxymethylaminomethyl(34) synthesis GTPase MnmE [Flavobacteriales bacterium]
MNDTITALATSQGNGAIAVIRMSGDESKNVVSQFFRPINQKELSPNKVQFGNFIDQDETLIDEVLVTYFKNPKSYTGEDSVEIACHNSTFIIQKIIQLLTSTRKVRLANAGEFTQRAFLNGKMDLSQAEAVADLIASENQASHRVALQQMRGGISNKLQELREKLINFTALLELELDFSEEDVEFANRSEFLALIKNLQSEIGSLINSFEYGNAIKNGIPVAILGKPNAGKSTLLNALLNEERAIVSDIAGTTRDTIEEQININGINFRFIDTAGIRETTDEIEKIGVQRAFEKAKSAKILLYLYNQKENTSEEMIQHLKDVAREDLHIILVHNKIDEFDGYSKNSLDEILKQKFNYPILGISAKETTAIEELKKYMSDTIQPENFANQVIVSNARHLEELQIASEELHLANDGFASGLSSELIAFHLRNILKHLGNITGEIDVDKDILGTIFGKFCIGK